MKGLLYYSDGTDYAAKVEEKMEIAPSDGENPRRFDAAKAEEYKKRQWKNCPLRAYPSL